MHGSLVADGQVVAAWRREAGSDDLTLLPLGDEVPQEAVAEFESLRAFYASTSAH